MAIKNRKLEIRWNDKAYEVNNFVIWDGRDYSAYNVEQINSCFFKDTRPNKSNKIGSEDMPNQDEWLFRPIYTYYANINIMIHRTI